MAGLSELDLKLSYHKGEDDIAGSFYLPCMRRSSSYDRAVGYFSSSVFVLAWPSLREFVASGGKIRLVCSPVLSDRDVEALNTGYTAAGAEEFATEAREELARLLASEQFQKPTTILASLVASGVIETKIAWVSPKAGGRSRRLFHDKVGIFSDQDESVVFKGSMNETWTGLAADGNLESVDVFATWRNDENAQRVSDEIDYFERLWANRQPGVEVASFPEVLQQDLLDAADPSRWEEYVDDVSLALEQAISSSADRGPGARIPRLHQIQAIDEWTSQGRRGILEHATGSGKTFTALCAIRDSFEKDEVVLVLVPSKLLLSQWKTELTESFGSDGLQLLVCGGEAGNKWSEGGRLGLWTDGEPDGLPHVVLATMQTASTERFRRQLKDGSHLFLVADEVHRVGSPANRRLLEIDSGPRLGLSATPTRAGDTEGTEAIMGYFNGVVPPPFTLQDAIAAGSLTPYAYMPHRVALNDDEQVEWNRLTSAIGKRLAIANGDEGSSIADEVLMLLIRRARIAKKAEAKTDLAISVLRDNYEQGQRWLVYCEDQQQLQAVRSGLRNSGISALYEYHSSMEGDPASTLQIFERHGGVLIAIRCLDEGVDIPATSHALILASSRNPREFIQRRGRVLRTAEGKTLAFVHDAIVLPNGLDGDVATGSMVRGELARAIEFGQHAINPDGVIKLRTLAVEYGLDWQDLTGEGFEIDDDE